MKLVDNWHRILLRAWSVRFVALASIAEVIVEIAPNAIPYLPIEWANRAVLAFMLAAIVSRIIQQAGLSNADR